MWLMNDGVYSFDDVDGLDVSWMFLWVNILMLVMFLMSFVLLLLWMDVDVHTDDFCYTFFVSSSYC